MASVVEFLAQLDQEDINKIESYLTQTGYQEHMLVQTNAEEDEQNMLPKIAHFLGQLSTEQIASMENYLMQIENAKLTGDDSQLAQLGASLDENLAAVADYLVQLEEKELAQVTGILSAQTETASGDF